MKKVQGKCSKCGNTTLGKKKTQFCGGRKKGKGIHPEKKGSLKCLSCQDVRYCKQN